MTDTRWIREEHARIPVDVLPTRGMRVTNTSGDIWLIIHCTPSVNQWAVARVDGGRLEFSGRTYEQLVDWLNDNGMSIV